MKTWKIIGAVAAAGFLATGCMDRSRNTEGTGGSGAEGDPSTVPESTTTTPSTEDTTSLPGSEMPAEPDTVPQGTSTPGDMGTGGSGTIDEGGAVDDGSMTDPGMDDPMDDTSMEDPLDPSLPEEEPLPEDSSDM